MKNEKIRGLFFLRGCARAFSAVAWLTIENREYKSLNFSKGCALFPVDWLTLETQENIGLIFSRGCALSVVDWLTMENRGFQGLNFLRCVCALMEDNLD